LLRGASRLIRGEMVRADGGGELRDAPGLKFQRGMDPSGFLWARGGGDVFRSQKDIQIFIVGGFCAA
jgi:hypothetical protein